MGSSYECDFEAHCCGGPHTNTVAGALKDDENTTIEQKSNSLRIDIGATLHIRQP